MQLLCRVGGSGHAARSLMVHPTDTAGSVRESMASQAGVCGSTDQLVSPRPAQLKPSPLLPARRRAHASPAAHPPAMQRLVHLGRTLDDGCTLASAGVGACSLVELLPRLAGGGGDGGATGAESRSSYLEMYMEKKPDKVDPGEQRLARWTTCHLSGEPLAPPCVADELGNLYNKDAVLQVWAAAAAARLLFDGCCCP